MASLRRGDTAAAVIDGGGRKLGGKQEIQIGAATDNHFRTPGSTLQHTTLHYNTLQHTATHCNTLQHTDNERQHTAAFYNTLQDAIVHANNLQNKATHVCFSQFLTLVVFLFACLFVSLSLFECYLHASLCVSLYVGLVFQEYVTDIITYTTYLHAIFFVLLESFSLSHAPYF